jgi:hypothetical protein
MIEKHNVALVSPLLKPDSPECILGVLTRWQGFSCLKQLTSLHVDSWPTVQLLRSDVPGEIL